jgi:hypothetical protein
MGEECLVVLAVVAVECLPGSESDSLTVESSVDMGPYLCCHNGLREHCSLERWGTTLRGTEEVNRSQCFARHYAWPGIR